MCAECRSAVRGIVVAVVVPKVRRIRGIGVRIVGVRAARAVVAVTVVRVGIAVGIRIAVWVRRSVRVGIAIWVRIAVRGRIARVCIISIVTGRAIPLTHIGNVVTAPAIPLAPTVIEETTVTLRRHRV